MEKEQILSVIKTKVEKESSRYLRLPKLIDFALRERCLYVTICEQGVVKNMQENSSAFESWIFALKCYIDFDSVVLDWVPIIDANVHYNRFLLRVYFFVESYDWVSICDNRNAEIWEIEQLVKNKKFRINLPNGEAKKEAENKEASLERDILDIWRGVHINDIFNHQLPVGLFEDQVCRKNQFTPGQGSQIDIWRVTEDVLRVYELKDEDNKRIGIISELMYYANVIHLLLNGNINVPQIKTENLRGEKVFYEKVQSKTIKNLEAIFFANKFHPLIEERIDDILILLNKNSFGIKYYHQELPHKDK